MNTRLIKIIDGRVILLKGFCPACSTLPQQDPAYNTKQNIYYEYKIKKTYTLVW